jgi:ABC-type protease/lipase transport system fused ATPase/permease subunit
MVLTDGMVKAFGPRDEVVAAMRATSNPPAQVGAPAAAPRTEEAERGG